MPMPPSSRLIDQPRTDAPCTSVNIASIERRNPVEMSSRGNQTKTNKCRPNADRMASSFGRGRSVSDIAANVTRSKSAWLNDTSKSCGNAVKACAMALPACPDGSKPNRVINVAKWVRNTGMRSGDMAKAALVQRPPVTERPTTVSPWRCGTTTMSNCTDRCTVELRLDFKINGAGPPSAKNRRARSILSGERSGVSLARDRPSRFCRVPSKAICSCAKTVRLPSMNQRTSAAPSPSGMPSASSAMAPCILRQSVTAQRTSSKTATSRSARALRSLASTRAVSR